MVRKKTKEELEDSISYLEEALNSHKVQLDKLISEQVIQRDNDSCRCGSNSFNGENLRDPKNDAWSYRLTCTKCQAAVTAVNAEECYKILSKVGDMVKVVNCSSCGAVRFKGIECFACNPTMGCDHE